MTPARVDVLVNAGLSELNVSLNADTPETHRAVMQMPNFERIVASCREIANARAERWPALRLHLSFVVTDRTASEAEPFVTYWRNSGVNQIWLHPLTNRTGLVDRNCLPVDMAPFANLYFGDPLVKVNLFPEHDGPANLCRITDEYDFISVDGDMLLCGQDYMSRHRFGNVAGNKLTELHRDKVLRHLRGETSDTCSTCSFCPSAFKKGRKAWGAIVEAGAV
jgi:radical SAM protein with 4Fe4S-binding SPASM domain